MVSAYMEIGKGRRNSISARGGVWFSNFLKAIGSLWFQRKVGVSKRTTETETEITWRNLNYSVCRSL